MIRTDQVDEAVEILKNVELSITGINIAKDKDQRSNMTERFIVSAIFLQIITFLLCGLLE